MIFTALAAMIIKTLIKIVGGHLDSIFDAPVLLTWTRLESSIERSRLFYDHLEMSIFDFANTKLLRQCATFKGTFVCWRIFQNILESSMTFSKRFSTSAQRDGYRNVAHLGILSSTEEFPRIF